MKKESIVLNYLKNLPKDERELLNSVRNQILSLIPSMEERLSRGVPFFYYKGKRAVGFRSSKTHLSFFIMEGNVLKDLEEEICNLDYSNTVIRFNPKQPIPSQIIEKLVLARVKEIDNNLNLK